jgi:hypothetical protein
MFSVKKCPDKSGFEGVSPSIALTLHFVQHFS